MAGVITSDNADPILERFVGTDVYGNPKVADQIKAFFAQHLVKHVVVSDGIMGCPHEEGIDFPDGSDCPFCPFWKGKQGSNRRD